MITIIMIMMLIFRPLNFAQVQKYITCNQQLLQGWCNHDNDDHDVLDVDVPSSQAGGGAAREGDRPETQPEDRAFEEE